MLINKINHFLSNSAIGFMHNIIFIRSILQIIQSNYVNNNKETERSVGAGNSFHEHLQEVGTKKC